jgi:hypothetical protein
MKKLEFDATFYQGQVLPLVNASLAYCFRHNLTKLVYIFGGVSKVESYLPKMTESITVKMRYPNGKVFKTYTFQGHIERQFKGCIQCEIIPGTIVMS